MKRFPCIFALILASWPMAITAKTLEKQVFTLYRNSAVGENMRIHVATFDVESRNESYNFENCQIAAKLFQMQPGVSVTYWCERGRYKE